MAEKENSRDDKGFEDTLEKRRKRGPTPAEGWRGPNTGAWEKLYSGWRGRVKYSRAWNSGYDGPGKGTN